MIVPIMILMSVISRSFGIQNRPHIIFIVADDLGWNDVGWHNKHIHTPNLNKLARKGVILDQSYVQPVCTPTRSALMTGYYPFHTGLQHRVIDEFEPSFLQERFQTLPQKLKELGYKTHIVGKWHLGYCDWKYTPTRRGFDSFLGFYGGHQFYFNHSFARGAHWWYDFRIDEKVFYPQGNQYSSELFADRVIEIINDVDPSEQSLYLYLAFQSVHGPLQVPKRYLNMYRHIKPPKRRTKLRMVTALDEAVGKVTDALESKGFLENAILVFTTDNGAPSNRGGNNLPLRGEKGSLWEGGTRGAAFIYSKNLLKKTKYVNKKMIHVVDWFPTILTLAGGTPDSKLDGVNQWQALSEDAKSSRDEFVYNIDEIQGYSAIRRGKHKLIKGSGAHLNSPKVHLFDLENDPFEEHNIADQHEHIVEELEQRLAIYSATLEPSMNIGKRVFLSKEFNNILSPGWC